QPVRRALAFAERRAVAAIREGPPVRGIAVLVALVGALDALQLIGHDGDLRAARTPPPESPTWMRRQGSEGALRRLPSKRQPMGGPPRRRSHSAARGCQKRGHGPARRA